VLSLQQSPDKSESDETSLSNKYAEFDDALSYEHSVSLADLLQNVHEWGREINTELQFLSQEV